MINTRIRYIAYTHTGGGVRHHHFTAQNDIVAEANGQATQGDTIVAFGFPTLPYNGVYIPFAFMSVYGDANGNQLVLTPGNQTFTVGTSDIDIMVVYAQMPGGPGGGGPGVWVDAFNVDVGGFSDSLQFIEVLTPPTPPDTLDAAKTAWANSDGVVSTAAAENIRANQYVDGVPFLKWKKIIPVPAQVNTPDISLAQNESGEIWFAFYQTPAGSGGVPNFHGNVYEALEYGIWVWGGDDECGNGGHWVHPKGPGPSPWAIKLDKRVIEQLSPSQQKKLDRLVQQYPELANAAYGAMLKVVDMLKEVNQIVSGIKGQVK